MKISAKELLLILISILVASWIPLFLSFFGVNFGDNSYFNQILFLVIVFFSIIVVVYRRMGEIDKALEIQETKQKGLEEKLKRSEELINIKSDIKNLYNLIQNGKKS